MQDGGGKLHGRAIPTIGYRGMHSFDLAFENFFVPDANVIGGEGGLGKGFYLTMAGMVGGRMQTAGARLGRDARGADGGDPVREGPQGVRCAAHRLSADAGQDRADGGALRGVPAARLCGRAACSTAAAGAWRRASSSCSRAARPRCVTREALQIHGGMGYAEETPVSRYFVDARVLSIFEGAEETLALKVVAKSLLENALGSQLNGHSSCQMIRSLPACASSRLPPSSRRRWAA